MSDPYLRDVAPPDVVVARGDSTSTALLGTTVTDAVVLLVRVAGRGRAGEPVIGSPGARVALRYGLDLSDLIANAGVTGALGQVVTAALPRLHHGVTPDNALPWYALCRTLIFVGVGDARPSQLRTAGGHLARATVRYGRVVVVWPGRAVLAAPDDITIRALVDGYVDAQTDFPLAQHRAAPSDDNTPEEDDGLSEVFAAGPRSEKAARQLVLLTQAGPTTRLQAVVSAALELAGPMGLARDLVDTPPQWATPVGIAQRAASIGQDIGADVEIFDDQRLLREGFGGIVAAGSGSRHGPRLVVVDYVPDEPAVGESVALVGAGVTFNSGGLSLKVRASMPAQKAAMAGAAAVLGTVVAAARARIPRRVTAVLALAENLPGAAAYRPGDVVRTWEGSTVEVTTTDAAGRLVLADALAWAHHTLHPGVVIDVATLSGATPVALGQRAALLSDDDELAAALARSAERAGELVWRLPLVAEYETALHSGVADVRLGEPPADTGAGAISAGQFLRRFVGGSRWAHLDIAGCAWRARPHEPWAAGATGAGVRLLVDYLTA